MAHVVPPCPPLASRPHKDILILFDVDGTLAIPAQRATDSMLDLLAALRQEYAIGIVGAAHFEKQQDQLAGNLAERFDFVFSENGVHAFRDGAEIHSKSMAEHLGSARWSAFEVGLDAILSAEHAAAARLLSLASPGTSIGSRSTFIEKRRCTMK